MINTMVDDIRDALRKGFQIKKLINDQFKKQKE